MGYVPYSFCVHYMCGGAVQALARLRNEKKIDDDTFYRELSYWKRRDDARFTEIPKEAI